MEDDCIGSEWLNKEKIGFPDIYIQSISLRHINVTSPSSSGEILTLFSVHGYKKKLLCEFNFRQVEKLYGAWRTYKMVCLENTDKYHHKTKNSERLSVFT